MTPERWQQITRIASAAMELDAEQRADFLDKECAGDAELRQAVEDVLREDRSSGGSIEAAIAAVAAEVRPAAGAEPSDAMLGHTISHYKIVEKLGQGGMGVVYKAEDTKLERSVALKFLASHLLQDEEGHERFLREAKAAAALDHNNICTVYEIDEAEGQTFLAMAFIEGQSLKEKIDERPLKLDEALDLAIQTARGLEAAHKKGIVHRDIKPANLMRTGEGTVKIMDFGLAQLAGRTKLTKTGSSLGTPAYMSPEQTLGQKTDQRSDIWSLGVVLYEMVTGQLPFKGDVEATVAYSIVNEDQEPLTALRTGVPVELDRVVGKALAKNPDERYQHIEEMAVDLRAISRTLNESPRHAPRAKVSESPAIVTVSEKKETAPLAPSKIGRAVKRRAVAGVALLAVALMAWLSWQTMRNTRIAKTREMIPEIRRLIDERELFQAYQFAKEAEQTLGEDPALADLWLQISREITLRTDPPGADLSVKPHADAERDWMQLTQTPVENFRVPRATLLWKIEKAGYVPVVRLVGYLGRSFRLHEDGTISVRLAKEQDHPEDMVRVAGGEVVFRAPKLNQVAAEVQDFWLDRHEVTNQDFKRFVDAGGYQDKKYWKQRFTFDGRELSWEEAMLRFRDATGRPGPVFWELSDYPSGQGRFPVQGLSWYEAAAYAEFVGKQLPTIFHWLRGAGALPESIAASNIDDPQGPIAAGRSGAIGVSGAVDMFGNVREWCWNATSPSGEQRYLLGAAWSDPAYRASGVDGRDAFDRSPENGFRCVRYIEEQPAEGPAFRAAFRQFRDPSTVEPLPQAAFNAYTSLFAYDAGPLNAKILEIDSSPEHWTREKVEFDAAYNNERMIAHLFLPKGNKAPHQVVVYFPGSGAFRGQLDFAINRFAFLVRGGRAVVFPIYQGSYDRGRPPEPELSYPNPGTIWRDHLVQWSKDLGRAIDYVETRQDLKAEKMAYLGVSRGASVAPVMVAMEKRLRTAILLSGGLWAGEVRPEIDPIYFAPRVTVPILMINGRYDFVFAVDSSQRPLFEFFGTPGDHKKRVVFDVGHSLAARRTDVIRETLDWLDQYLGPVN